jgi:hypothetical protein
MDPTGMTFIPHEQPQNRVKCKLIKRCHVVVVFLITLMFSITSNLTTTIESRNDKFRTNPVMLNFADRNQSFSSSTDEVILDALPPFLITSSGCRMARWVYPADGRKRAETYDDCQHVPAQLVLEQPTTKGLVNSSRGVGGWNIRQYDTVYVTIHQLPTFVNKLLPLIDVDIVLISGQQHKLPRSPPIPILVVEAILDHPNILHWFCHNLDYHLGQFFDDMLVSDQQSPRKKLSPFPYGMRPSPDALEQYHKVLKHYKRYSEYRRPVGSIYWSPISGTNKIRRMLPGYGKHVSSSVLYDNMAKHQFVISPIGDRSECYRHYEALGLGAIPVILTDKSSSAERATLHHLTVGPALIIALGDELQQQHISGGKVNWTQLVERHVTDFLANHSSPVISDMVLESYWALHMEQIVQHSLGWRQDVNEME